MTTLTQPIKYHGGKHYLAKKILALMPEHTHYVEPYFGGGSVLLAKDPEGISEVVNDIDGELMNFWRVLQFPSWFEELQQILESTPFSQLEFQSARMMARVVQHGLSSPERAARFFVLARQSRQGLNKDFATLSRTRTRRGMNEQASSWLTAIDGLPEVATRLRRVVVLSDQATKVIRQQDGPKTLFYLDPPYLPETRSVKSSYKHEMARDQHAELLETLRSIEGKFMLSGYRSEMYDHQADLYGWRRESFDVPNNASGSAKKERRCECVWMNY
jgi:DNA adenine methylase